MRIEADCPVCDGPLSIWDGCKAKNPYEMTCPHCMSKVLIRAASVRFVYKLVILAYIGLAGLAFFQLFTFRFGGYFEWLVAIALLLLVSQVILTLLAFNGAELEAGEPDL